MNAKNRPNRLLTGKAAISLILLLAGFLSVSVLYTVPESRATAGEALSRPESFTALAERNSPAVVNIQAERNGRGGPPMMSPFHRGPMPKDDPFHDFFDKFFGGPPQREFKQRSLGSGFIFDKDGHIVTNNHVVAEADNIKVILKNGKEFDAQVKGRDPNTDLALIKIEPTNDLPVLELGDSDALKVGEWILAIGNPFGLEHTVTAGIISAKGRVIGSGPYDDFIQTDASINPGNSGGPLITMDGKVVGINTAIVAGGQGIGFAIPVNLARGVIDQLKTSGQVTRGWLGVGIQDLTPELKEYYGLKEGKGVLVTQVFPGDPADQAGLKAGDVILKVNGKEVDTSRELSRVIAEAPVGQKVAVSVLRKGDVKAFQVELSKRKDTPMAGTGDTLKEGHDFGIAVADITPEAARRYQLKDPAGVMVTGVAPGSAGEKAGFRPGDVIREINHEPVADVAAYEEETAKIASGDTASFYILRPGRGFMVIKLTQ
jgi:serine protease Do